MYVSSLTTSHIRTSVVIKQRFLIMNSAFVLPLRKLQLPKQWYWSSRCCWRTECRSLWRLCTSFWTPSLHPRWHCSPSYMKTRRVIVLCLLSWAVSVFGSEYNCGQLHCRHRSLASLLPARWTYPSHDPKDGWNDLTFRLLSCWSYCVVSRVHRIQARELA